MAAPPELSRHGTSPLACSLLRYTPPVGGGAGGAWAEGSGQASWMLPSQAAIWSGVLLVVLPPGSVRHRPDAWLTRLLPGPWLHTWVPVPVQVPRTTGVPGAIAPPEVSRHRPLIRMVPSGSMTQFCSASFWQVVSWKVVPAAEASHASSTHMAATP